MHNIVILQNYYYSSLKLSIIHSKQLKKLLYRYEEITESFKLYKHITLFSKSVRIITLIHLA